jgi:hypothetical protein
MSSIGGYGKDKFLNKCIKKVSRKSERRTRCGNRQKENRLKLRKEKGNSKSGRH